MGKNFQLKIRKTIFVIDKTYINSDRKNALSFNFLLKKTIWTQLSKLLIFFFNFGIGKSMFSSLFSQLITLNNSEGNSNLSKKRSCLICNNSFTHPYKTNCEHTFCFFCIVKHKKSSELCPV